MRIDQRLKKLLEQRKAKRALCDHLRVTTAIPNMALDYMGYYTWQLHQDTVARDLWEAWRQAHGTDTDQY